MATPTPALPGVKALLEKKATFEKGIARLRDVLSALGARAFEDEEFTRLLARCHSLLRSRYNAPAYWNAARELYLQASSCCPTNQAMAGRLNSWIQDCRAQLEGEPDSEAASVQPQPAYAFQGQLSGEEPPRMEQADGQALLTALMAAATGMGSGVSDMPGAHDPQEFMDEHLLRALEESAAEVAATTVAPPASRFVVERLPRHVVPESGVDTEFGPGTACTVCMEELRPGDEVHKLPCAHVLHVPCLAPWLQEHNSCPVCRHELPTDDARYEREKAEADAQKGARNAVSHAELLYL